MVGEPLPPVSHVAMTLTSEASKGGVWTLRGVTSNERYVTRSEKTNLVAAQEGLGRPQCQCAAIIPIRKSPAWWALTQDERRRIFEEQSGHIKIGMRALPGVARRLHHCRDLGTAEPFDFVTWFEFEEKDTDLFENLLSELRATPEWEFIDREVDIRLRKAASCAVSDGQA